ncbi:MAG: CrcB family protein [Candidatus Gastranaerophilales bacterium]|nr:CrcB family protein [Candidatus Gastranaerophilales bacterium]
MNFLAVFLGGGLGALIRYFLSFALPKPCCTLAANFFGCFFAAAVFTFFVIKSDINSMYKTLLITGFCGGLSTLSALSLEVMEFVQSGDYIKAGLYIVTSLLICVISVILGIVLVRKYV